jgi:hypothetical protein
MSSVVKRMRSWLYSAGRGRGRKEKKGVGWGSAEGREGGRKKGTWEKALAQQAFHLSPENKAL